MTDLATTLAIMGLRPLPKPGEYAGLITFRNPGAGQQMANAAALSVNLFADAAAFSDQGWAQELSVTATAPQYTFMIGAGVVLVGATRPDQANIVRQSLRLGIRIGNNTFKETLPVQPFGQTVQSDPALTGQPTSGPFANHGGGRRIPGPCRAFDRTLVFSGTDAVLLESNQLTLANGPYDWTLVLWGIVRQNDEVSAQWRAGTAAPCKAMSDKGAFALARVAAE